MNMFVLGTIMALFFSILGLFLVIWILLTLLYTRVPWVKTPEKNISLLLENFVITPSDRVYDLGCGDAAVLEYIERKTGASTKGFEISPLAFFLAKGRIVTRRLKTEVVYENFMKSDLTRATVVFCFLIGDVMQKVAEYLQTALRPGTKIVSYGYQFPDLQLDSVIKTRPGDSGASSFYVYSIQVKR